MTACKNEDDCRTPMWCRGKSRCPNATSAEGTREHAASLGALALATCWTAPSAIPSDVARKIIAARDALAKGDTNEAWHQLYSIADPRFESVTPWANLEAQSNS